MKRDTTGPVVVVAGVDSAEPVPLELELPNDPPKLKLVKLETEATVVVAVVVVIAGFVNSEAENVGWFVVKGNRVFGGSG